MFKKIIIATKTQSFKKCTNITIWTAHEFSRLKYFERDFDFVEVIWAEGSENQANT